MINIQPKKALLTLFIVLFCASLLANGWLGYQLFTTLAAYQSQQIDARVLSFTSMFVDKILMANKEIDFDTRLSLEASVRSLNDQQIFDQWQAFTKAQTKEDASQQAKLLLNLLVKKIKAQK